MINLIKGLKYKYPLCCIIQYTILRWFRINPAERMWNKFNMSDEEIMNEVDDNDCVLCDRCMRIYLKNYKGRE